MTEEQNDREEEEEEEKIKVSPRLWPESWKLWDRTNPDDASFQFGRNYYKMGEKNRGCSEQSCVCVGGSRGGGGRRMFKGQMTRLVRKEAWMNEDETERGG